MKNNFQQQIVPTDLDKKFMSKSMREFVEKEKKQRKREKERKEMRKDKWLNRSIVFHDYINGLLFKAYRQLRKIDYKVEKPEATENLYQFIKKIPSFKGHEFQNLERKREERIKRLTIEEKLETLGKFNLTFEEISSTNEKNLFGVAKKYDWKGIITGSNETIQDLVCRANSILHVNRIFKKSNYMPKLKLDKKTFDVDIGIQSIDKERIKQEDIEEANKRIPYSMDLSWINAFSRDDLGILSGAYGVCFTLPKYNGLNFVLMRNHYKSRDKYLDVLAHEMTHMGTVYLDSSRRLLETKAYVSGTASLGEYTIALNTRPNLVYRIAKYATIGLLHIDIPDGIFNRIPMISSAMGIFEHRHTFKKTRERLQNLYGEKKGDYILGRLTAEEVDEMYFTNNIEKRVDMKEDLKWKIMKSNINWI